MTHFQSRSSLLEYVENHSPTRAIQRAMVYGTVRLLGGFSPLPPSSTGGWIVEITSHHGKKWFIGVYPTKRGAVCKTLSQVPWKNYRGSTNHKKGSLEGGDDPVEFSMISHAYGRNNDGTRTRTS